jgi:hypothetical protein
MTTSTIHIPPLAREPLLERASARYPEIEAELLAQLTETAAASVEPRGLPDLSSRQTAAHVTISRLASSHIAKLDRGRLITAAPMIDSVEPADIALAEHLDPLLTREELLAAALRFARALPARAAASALNLTVSELKELEESAWNKAAELTLAYHEDMICEPAALSGADRPDLRVSAVREHISTCRSCRSEFNERVGLVLAHTGAMLDPLPPLVRDHASEAGGRGRGNGLLLNPRGALRPARDNARRTRSALAAARGNG